MKVRRISPVSGTVNEVDLPITEQQMEQWEQGMPVQRAFPNLSASQREFILTGITEDEWNELFQFGTEDTL